MNLPISWLRSYVNLEKDFDIKSFMDGMTMSGSKVEGVVHLGAEISNVVVGKVMSIVPHPNADKLVITRIDVGQPECLQIVTGATNLYEGAIVPVALDGATLSGGIKIKAGKLRGELSCGMLCSIEELGYTRNDYPESPEDGIYIFNTEEKLGSDVRSILELCDDVVEFEITSNRSDCFSVLGLAREAAATFKKQFKPPVITVAEKGEGKAEELIGVEIKNPKLCPRYIARVVKNVKIEPSPQWLRHMLTAAGIRPINNIVDITNYVMLEYGQPMHAFDINCISGSKIIVRNAEDGEKFKTLDGVERTLDSSMLVIADEKKAVALAGIMGGENSMITGKAGAVLFESACFDGTNIRVTSKKIGLRTDSSGKFEKGLDPNLALDAVNRAVQLVEELNAGEVVKGMVDCYPNKRTEWKVPYSYERVNALLGTKISQTDMEKILYSLEIKSENGVATIPTFRPDLEAEADIAEEIARIYGYNNIEESLASGTPTVGKKNQSQQLEELTKETMVAQGFSEALTYAFESPKVFDKLLILPGSSERNTVKIMNPLGEDFSIMRTSTLNAMLVSIANNYNKRNEDAALFELAKKYMPRSLPLTELPKEIPLLSMAAYGRLDFYGLKGAIENLAKRLGVELTFAPDSSKPYMHPGSTASISINDMTIGFCGEVHPTVLDNYGIGAKTFIAVMELEPFFEKSDRRRVYVPVPKYPGIKRDIAVIVKDEVLAADIENAIKERAGKMLEQVKLFDVYKGKNLAEGTKSMAYSIYFRAPDRTLTDDEIVVSMKKILENLDSKLGAYLRDK